MGNPVSEQAQAEPNGEKRSETSLIGGQASKQANPNPTNINRIEMNRLVFLFIRFDLIHSFIHLHQHHRRRRRIASLDVLGLDVRRRMVIIISKVHRLASQYGG